MRSAHKQPNASAGPMPSMHIILKTPRLTVRRFTEGDIDNLFDLNSDPEVMRYLTGGRSTPREEIRDQIARDRHARLASLAPGGNGTLR